MFGTSTLIVDVAQQLLQEVVSELDRTNGVLSERLLRLGVTSLRVVTDSSYVTTLREDGTNITVATIVALAMWTGIVAIVIIIAARYLYWEWHRLRPARLLQYNKSPYWYEWLYVLFGFQNSCDTTDCSSTSSTCVHMRSKKRKSQSGNVMILQEPENPYIVQTVRNVETDNKKNIWSFHDDLDDSTINSLHCSDNDDLLEFYSQW